MFARLVICLALALPMLAQDTTILLVRHAEKAGTEGDVPLSDVGIARANELARVLAGVKIDAIYTTPYKRTRDTAKPVAEAMKITPIEIASGKTYASDLVSAIFKNDAGKTVLVVGHSNTTVSVLRELGVPDPAPIADSQYDDLFVCHAKQGPPAQCTALRYGAVAR